ncbi:MAG: transposase [Actinobacteria bacterium]|nr:transposase [Actinomycetota bacterium]
MKKPLNQRRHRCENCGLDLDRDLFSAFLMHHVRNKNGHQELDLDAARENCSVLLWHRQRGSEKASSRHYH